MMFWRKSFQEYRRGDGSTSTALGELFYWGNK
jgi:hypothetical protein